MRDLTPEECEFIAGGLKTARTMSSEYDPPEIVVVASPPPYYPPPYYPPYEPPQSPPPPPTGGGGGGGGSSPPGDPVHTSPGGHTYHYNGTLDSSQIAIADKIVDWGFSHGKTPDQVRLAVNQAFYESSLGNIRSNPNNANVEGLYQYDASTWHDLGHDGLNRGSDNDQIQAMFQDIDRYTQRYQAGEAANNIPSNLSFEDYLEVKHHLGNSSTNWGSPVVNDYNAKTGKLGFGD